MATVHLIIAICTGLVVLYADEQAAAWVLGKREFFHPDTVVFLHRAVSSGLALLLITGGILYYQAPPAYLTLPAFEVKIVMVFAIICNTYFVDRFSRIATTRSFSSLSRRERLPLYLSGGISFLGWVTAFACGLLIA